MSYGSHHRGAVPPHDPPPLPGLQQTLFSVPPPAAPLDVSIPPPVVGHRPPDVAWPPPVLVPPPDVLLPPPGVSVPPPDLRVPPPFLSMPPPPPLLPDMTMFLTVPPPNVALNFPPPALPEYLPSVSYPTRSMYAPAPQTSGMYREPQSVGYNPRRDSESRSRECPYSKHTRHKSEDDYRERSQSHDSDHRRSSRHSSSNKDAERHQIKRSSSSRESTRHRDRSRDRSTSRHYDRERHEHRARHQSPARSHYRERSESSSHKRERPSENRSLHRSRSPTFTRRSRGDPSDRERILVDYRKDYCKNVEEIEAKLTNRKPDSKLGQEKPKTWYRSSPAEVFYSATDPAGVVKQSARLAELCATFHETLIERGRRARPEVDELPPLKPQKPKLCKHLLQQGSSSSSEEEGALDEDGETDRMIMELQRKQSHPRRLHLEMWYNHTGEMNGGPLCRCNSRARRLGMRHNVFADEPTFPRCDPTSSNLDKLFHYTITVSPATNFLIKTPTIISHDEHEFLFSGFSMFSHYKLQDIPMCKVIRFNIEYTILIVEEQAPQNFSIQELDLFEEYLFTEILELVDLDLGKASGDKCSQFHFMPRFLRNLRDGGSEVLSMCEVLFYLLDENELLIPPSHLKEVHKMDRYTWQRFIDRFQGMIVTYPGKKPCSIRVDQLDRHPPETSPERSGSKRDRASNETKPDTIKFEPNMDKYDFECKEEVKNWSDDNSCKRELNDSPVDQKPNVINFGSGIEGADEQTFSAIKREQTPTVYSERGNTERRNSEHTPSRQRDRRHTETPSRKDCSERRHTERSSRNRSSKEERFKFFPEIVHFGIRPPQLSYAGNPEYQKTWRFYLKYRHLIANMSKPTPKDKQKLQETEEKLQQMRIQSKMKRDVTVAISSEGFYATGLMCDVVQHAMLIPVLVRHLRFHKSLDSLEKKIKYKFQSRALLQKALTHPSYRENFGTNPDHARNSLTNCGIRQPEYGDRKIHYTHTRKKGINILINIMSRFGERNEKESAINHNERLEFLGDAVVEFVSSVHLFMMFPGLAEGGLATFRAAVVQNQHLALLATKIHLDKYMLFAHGSDLCRDIVMRHAMANCFEALMGAVFLDGGLQAADNVFSLALWLGEPNMWATWTRPRLHPLQEQEPLGDRQYIGKFEFLQKLVLLEESTGIKFKHIRLLARAFTDRSVGFTHLTLGSNQRLEFLGDTVLQLVVSAYLYRHFPGHHEGHLSLLRSSLVNNRTQSIICDDLGMAEYAVYNNPKAKPTTKKHKADLLEAFFGALYIDKGLEYCEVFCNVCMFPRLEQFITNQDWNDPKSKLQQCCLTLRSIRGGEPDIPIYKVIESLGPTNTRVYTVAVYFAGVRLAKATGLSIQEAEMNAAKEALKVAKAPSTLLSEACSSEVNSKFPQLDHQKRVIYKTKKNSSNKKRTASKKSKGAKDSDAIRDRLPRAYREDNECSSSDDESINCKVEGHEPEADVRSIKEEPLDADDSTLKVTSLVTDMQNLRDKLLKKNKLDSLQKATVDGSEDSD